MNLCDYPINAKSRFACEVVDVLRGAGFTALWAGGCVRDLLLGESPTDYDVATDAPATEVLKLFRRTVPVGVSFGVVRVLGPKSAGEVEVATFRTDGVYRDGRRPESVEFGTPLQDAQRRDFTINGMFLDPITREVIDHVGGRDDLRAGIVRAIGDPHERFTEDKLRLIRAVRFTARFDFELEPVTRRALEAMAGEIVVVAPERIGQELRRMLTADSRADAMELAMNTGLLAAILPVLPPLLSEPTPPGYQSSNRWQHSVATLRQLSRSMPSVFELALAALLQALPADQIPQIAHSLRLSNDERDLTHWLVEHLGGLGRFWNWSIPDRKRMLIATHFDALLALHRAVAEAEQLSTGVLDEIATYRETEPEGPLNPPPLINGNDLKEMGVKPGPEFRRLLELVRDAQLEGAVQNRDEALRLVGNSIAPG